MTSRQFVDFLTAKLIEHGGAKVIPGAKMLKDSYSLFVRGDRMRRVVKEALAAMSKQKIVAPADLAERVLAHLAEHPEAAWNEAVSTIVAADSSGKGPP